MVMLRGRVCCVGGVTWMWIGFFKQKTAYEVRISDWSSDVCSSDRGAKRLECRVEGETWIAEALGDLPHEAIRRVAHAARLGVAALGKKVRKGGQVVLRADIAQEKVNLGGFAPSFVVDKLMEESVGHLLLPR